MFKKITPNNYTPDKLNILVGCADFSTISGAPLCIYTTSKEMIKKGHQVTIASMKIGEPMKAKAIEAGIKVLDMQVNKNKLLNNKYDVLQLNTTQSWSLLNYFPDVPAFHIVRSQLEVETPIADCPQIRKYICVREEVLEHIVKEHNIPREKCVYIPTGVDFERFNVGSNGDHKPYVILSPSTIDLARKPMLLDLIERVKKSGETLILMGKDFGALKGVNLPSNVKIKPPRWEVEYDIGNADEVVSFLEGRVVYEAWAMEKPVTIYNEDNKIVIDKQERPKNYERFSVNYTANEYYKVYTEKWADIIIPHHDKPDLLSTTLKCIPIRNYNVNIIRGTYFSRACNKGAKIAETNTLIFANDDLEFKPQVLWELIDSNYDVTGVEQFYPDGTKLCAGAGFYPCGNRQWFGLVVNEEDMLFVSGALFRISKQNYFDLGQLDESYINGGEDRELFLNALEKGLSTGLIKTPAIHHCSQSKGRFDYLDYNEELNKARWTEQRVNNLLKNLGKEYLLSKEKNMTISSTTTIQRAVPDKRDKPKEEIKGLKVELGATNPTFDQGDWVHVDLREVPHAEHKANFVTLPFEENSVSEIFGKRSIQHLSKEEALTALKDWLRVLVKDGKLTLVVVNITQVMNRFLQSFDLRYLVDIFGKQEHIHGHYKSGYTPQSLTNLLKEAGFDGVSVVYPNSIDFDPSMEFVIEAYKQCK